MNSQINLFVKELKRRGITLGLAESITCGMVAHKLATCKGVADVLKGSIVCYSPEVKMDLLKVNKKTIDKYTCESMEVTEELTSNLSKLIKCDVSAALTGLASEGGSETKNKPVGTVFFCMKYKNKIYKERKLFRGSPLEIRKKACLELYDFILSKIK
jgi:nicotinamide-nucleotide amidase